MARRPGATFIRGMEYVTFEHFPDGKHVTGKLVDDFKLPGGFWTPGARCAALNDQRDGHDVCYLFCNDKYVTFDWNSRTCTGPAPISDWSLPSEFAGGVSAAANGRGTRAGSAFFFVGSRWVEHTWSLHGTSPQATGMAEDTKTTDASGNFKESHWDLPWQFCTDPRCGVLGEDGGRRANTSFFVEGAMFVRYDWNTWKANQLAEGLGFLPAPFNNGVIAAMEGSLLTATKPQPSAPNQTNHAATEPPGLAAHIATLKTSIEALEKANAELAEFDLQMSQFAALTRQVTGFVAAVLMEKDLLVGDPGRTSNISTVFRKTQELYRVALEEIRNPGATILTARTALVNVQHHAEQALMTVIHENPTFEKEIEDFAVATGDGEWGGKLAQITADAIAELGKGSLAAQIGDEVADALEGGNRGITGVLLRFLRVEGKASKAFAKSMSAAKGSDSLVAACLTLWAIRRAIEPADWLNKPLINARVDKYADLFLHHISAKSALADDAAKMDKLRAALKERDFIKAKNIIGGAFAPAGVKWRGFALVFKIGETLVNTIKALDSTKDLVDEANSAVGTANDTLRFVSEINNWKQIRKGFADAIESAQRSVGTFTSVCTIVSGGLQFFDAIDKVDGAKMVAGWASVGSGTCLLVTYLFAASTIASVAGPLFVVGVALGAIAATINLWEEVKNAMMTHEQKALERLIDTVENFHHKTLFGGPYHKQGSTGLQFGVENVRAAFAAVPPEQWPTVKDCDATLAVLSKLGIRGRIESTLFPRTPAPAPAVQPPQAGQPPSK